MNYYKWLDKNAKELKGKTVAITGSTGGIGIYLCEFFAYLGADLILLNRSKAKNDALANALLNKYPNLNIKSIELKLDDITAVKSSVNQLKSEKIDIIIHNAGAYSIPRCITDIGVDNVFQINCLAPLYITEQLMNNLKEIGGKVVFVGSIAHNYSKYNPKDFDFSSYKAASKVYGNAKRCLMLTVYEYFKTKENVSFSVTHPGITFTNITNHYPKLVFAIIKNPMKVIFMPPQKAALSILMGVFQNCEYGEWIGPKIFNIWGLPKKQKLKTFSKKEAHSVYSKALELLKNM